MYRLPIADENWLHVSQEMHPMGIEDWVIKFFKVWAESGSPGWIPQRSAIYVELKSVVNPAKAISYVHRVLTGNYITYQEALRTWILKHWQFPWIIPIISFQKPHSNIYISLCKTSEKWTTGWWIYILQCYPPLCLLSQPRYKESSSEGPLRGHFTDFTVW